MSVKIVRNEENKLSEFEKDSLFTNGFEIRFGRGNIAESNTVHQ